MRVNKEGSERGRALNFAYGLGGKHLIVALILKCYHDS